MKQNVTYLVDKFCKLTILHHTLIEECAVKLHSWTFSFHKIVRQQIWGEVVDFITGFLQFIWECTVAVKELLKSVNIWVRNDENMKRMFFYGTQCSSLDSVNPTAVMTQVYSVLWWR